MDLHKILKCVVLDKVFWYHAEYNIIKIIFAWEWALCALILN